jgi:hypothetical protein
MESAPKQEGSGKKQSLFAQMMQAQRDKQAKGVPAAPQQVPHNVQVQSFPNVYDIRDEPDVYAGIDRSHYEEDYAGLKDKDRTDIDRENLAKLKAMTPEEIIKMQEMIRQTMRPGFIDKLKSKAIFQKKVNPSDPPVKAPEPAPKKGNAVMPHPDLARELPMPQEANAEVDEEDIEEGEPAFFAEIEKKLVFDGDGQLVQDNTDVIEDESKSKDVVPHGVAAVLNEVTKYEKANMDFTQIFMLLDSENYSQKLFAVKLIGRIFKNMLATLRVTSLQTFLTKFGFSLSAIFDYLVQKQQIVQRLLYLLNSGHKSLSLESLILQSSFLELLTHQISEYLLMNPYHGDFKQMFLEPFGERKPTMSTT